jgi:ACT domain-containing protein
MLVPLCDRMRRCAEHEARGLKLVMPGLSRASTALLRLNMKDVDGPDKPGHDVP